MCKVMLVDDKKLIFQGLLNIFDLEKIGLQVTEVSNNGGDALEKFIKDLVDIVISYIKCFN